MVFQKIPHKIFSSNSKDPKKRVEGLSSAFTLIALILEQSFKKRRKKICSQFRYTQDGTSVLIIYMLITAALEHESLF